MYATLLVFVSLLLQGASSHINFLVVHYNLLRMYIGINAAQNPWFILSTASPTTEPVKEARKLAAAPGGQNPWFILSTAAPTTEPVKEARKLAAAAGGQNPWFLLSTAAPTTTA